MRKIAINRVLSLLLAICFVLSIGFPNIYAVDGEVKSEASPFEQFVTDLSLLEQYADAFVAVNPDLDTDAFELVLNYCRTAKEEYTSSHWASLAGDENTAFKEYVEEQDALNETNVHAIKSYSADGKDMMYVANGNKIDLFHMFGTMNISYYWSSRYPETAARPYADLGGWAGDLVDLLTKSTDVSGTADEMRYEVYWNRFANDLGKGSFDIDDVYGDFDAFYCMQAHNSSGQKLSVIMQEYFTASLSMQDRANFFTANRFSTDLSQEELRTAVKQAYSSNILITALEGNEGLERWAACCLLRSVCRLSLYTGAWAGI